MGRVETDGGFWLVLGLMVLLLPLRFLAGVILAAAVHEAGHLLAIRWTGSRVLRLELHSGGARIVTDPRASSGKQPQARRSSAPWRDRLPGL